jgi:hypothetical protein
MTFDFKTADGVFEKLPVEAQELVVSGQYSFLQKNMKLFVLKSDKGTVYRINPKSGSLDIENNPSLAGYETCIVSPFPIDFDYKMT